MVVKVEQDLQSQLSRIINKDGSINVSSIYSQRKRGLSVGNVVSSNCIMGKTYKTTGKYSIASWRRKQYHAPIYLTYMTCKQERERSYINEHCD